MATNGGLQPDSSYVHLLFKAPVYVADAPVQGVEQPLAAPAAEAGTAAEAPAGTTAGAPADAPANVPVDAPAPEKAPLVTVSHAEPEAAAEANAPAKETPAATPVPAEVDHPGMKEALPKLPLHGPGTSGLLVLVHYPNHPTIPDAERQLLVNIIKAVNKDPRGLYLLNTAALLPENEPEQVSQIEADVVLGFGVSLQKFWPVKSNDPYLFTTAQKANQALLEADSLTDINAQIPLKKRLWSALKKQFGV